jgi:WD40 repeat protein
MHTRETSPQQRPDHEPAQHSAQPPSQQIVHAASQGLAVRSATLVLRGLRDLSRDSNWLIKKVFAGWTPRLAISATGAVSAISDAARAGSQRVLLYDIEMGAATLALSVPGESSPEQIAQSSEHTPAAFAWSPAARHLVAAWSAWQPALHIFDLQGKMLLGTFGDFGNFPAHLAWSEPGNYFAAASAGGKGASLRLWQATHGPLPFSPGPASEMGVPHGFERQTYEAEFGEEGAFSGYGRTAFSPNEKLLASVIEIRGDWADDSIVLADVPTLHKQNVFQAQGHITDLTWTPDSQQIVYCAAGQAYLLNAVTLNFEPLPFGAELCVCHPHLPLCICYSSWLRNSAKGRLFIYDIIRGQVFDEYAAEGIVDLHWSADGSKAFAMTCDGMAYIYEPPLI